MVNPSALFLFGFTFSFVGGGVGGNSRFAKHLRPLKV
jgi:hypothetical protein